VARGTSGEDAAAASPPLDLNEDGYLHPAVSPDGQQIAYIRRVPNTEPYGGQYRHDLWLANRDGTGVRPLVNHDARDVQSARRSPSGDLIAFNAVVWPGPEPNISNGYALFVVRLDGTGLRRIDHYTGGPGYAFSGDGSSILYSGVITDPARVPAGCSATVPVPTLIRVRLDTGAETFLNPCLVEWAAADVSRDGSKVSSVTFV
jgi:Tol biopolymer transport system component